MRRFTVALMGVVTEVSGSHEIKGNKKHSSKRSQECGPYYSKRDVLKPEQTGKLGGVEESLSR